VAVWEEVTQLGRRYLDRHSATVKEGEAVLREYDEAYRRLAASRSDVARDSLALHMYWDYRAQLMLHIEQLRRHDTLRINLSSGDLHTLMAAIDATLSAVYSHRHSHSRFSIRFVTRFFDDTLERLISTLEYSKKLLDASSREKGSGEQSTTFRGADASLIEGTIRNIFRDDLKYLYKDVHASIKANLSKLGPGEAVVKEMLGRFYHSAE
jgi:hypothetical protein